MCEHRDGSELAVAYSKQAPIILVSTGRAATKLGVKLTPNCSMDSGPEAILDFEPTARSVHICCFSGPGARRVCHKVTVPRGVLQWSAEIRLRSPRFAAYLQRPQIGRKW